MESFGDFGDIRRLRSVWEKVRPDAFLRPRNARPLSRK
jgi:hypothetical protein